MTNIQRSADCGNSPKNKLAEDVAVALETGDADFLTGLLDPKVEWRHPGGIVRTARGVVDGVGNGDMPNSLVIDHVVSHGKVAAINGTRKSSHNEERFCHVLEFTSATFKKIWRIESFGG